MFARVSNLCLISLVVFAALETALSDEENFKKPETPTIEDDEKNPLTREENFKNPETRATPHLKRRWWSRKGPRKVAFTAYLGDQKIHLAKQIIRYSRVTYNLGRGYRRGIFRAPSTGVYVFYFTSMPQRGKGDALWLVKNGRLVVESVSGRLSSAYNMGSNMAILHLRRGNKVWVQTSPKWKSAYTYKYKYSANSFSGFRLY
ncbi:otolin-1-A-like [Saccostrea echinata]|uniref:otolin-1-A-like n=1 Tax=Saccostrea echinata TaxID=191078 RepID=UPI002A803D81|nr:otolin-1-A-like [Saccostrea echinata]